MDVDEVIFVFFGIKWTLALLGTALVGALSAGGALYKIMEVWNTREERRLDMLRTYLDKEEKDITRKRTQILAGIQLAHNSYSEEKKFDVGSELDEAFSLIDLGRSDRAMGRLAELEKKLEINASMHERRAKDLKKHKASVQVFLGAIAGADGKFDIGLSHIRDALLHNNDDLDALKCQGHLHLRKGNLDLAENSFDKLRKISNGDDNAGYRADAHLGLASVSILKGVVAYDDALQSLSTALKNYNSLPPDRQDIITGAFIHQQIGNIYNNTSFSECDREKALQSLAEARRLLSSIPRRRGIARDRYHEVYAAIEKLEGSVD